MNREETFSPLNLFFANTLLKVAQKEQAIIPSPQQEEARRFLSLCMQSAREGNLCLSWERVLPPLLSSCVEEGKDLSPSAPIVRYKNRYYLQKNWVYETYILQNLERLLTRKLPSFYDREKFQNALDSEQDSLLPEQRRAIQHAFSHPLTFICGGPGTGKTYTASVLLRIFAQALSPRMKRFRVAVAAPTCKAALHLQSALTARGKLPSSILCTASTLHRLCRLRPGENKLFSGRRIDADLVLVDEGSMIEVSLWAHLLESIGEETQLIFLGDPNQLPPIGAGSLFSDLAPDLGVFLRQNMRSESFSLTQTADAILRGEPFFSDTPLSPITPGWIETLYCELAPWVTMEPPDPASCYARFRRVGVLNALRQGPWGADQINQTIFQRVEEECRIGDFWAIPILLATHLPRFELSKGMAGVLIGQRQDWKSLTSQAGVKAYFPGWEKPLPEVPPYELAFCVSIHKSQGEEFDRVIAMFPPGSECFGRESLYTAATRAKRGWSVCGEEETIRKMLQTRDRRESSLAERLREELRRSESLSTK